MTPLSIQEWASTTSVQVELKIQARQDGSMGDIRYVLPAHPLSCSLLTSTLLQGRVQSVISNYKTARTYGAQFILKMSDLWGADGTQLSSAIWPGDGGSCTEYDRYLTQLVADLKANGMTTAIKLLIWNEPDLGTVFWEPGGSIVSRQRSRGYLKC